MGNWDDISSKDASGLGIADDVIGVVADVGGAIGLIQVGISIFESLTSRDLQLQDVLNAIQADYNSLIGQAAAEDKLARMRDIDNGIAPAAAVFAELPLLLSSSPPPSTDAVNEKIVTCAEAVLLLAQNDEKWESVYAGFPYYSDGWSGKLAPTAGADGLVFNYTYTLPQFMRSIYILLTTIAALDHTALSTQMDVLEQAIARLQTVYDTIVNSGIVGTRIPTPANAGSWWTTVGNEVITYPYGAVEIFSGTSLVESYQQDFFGYEGIDMPAWGAGAQYFQKLLGFRIKRQMKALFVQLGMPSVRKMLDTLKALAGQAPDASAPYESWPFSEVASTLGISVPFQPVEVAGAEPRALETALRTFLSHTPPYIAFDVFGSDPVIDPRTHAKIPMRAHAVPIPSSDLYTFLTGVSLRSPVVEASEHASIH